jgi:dephospho-CoA kinase
MGMGKSTVSHYLATSHHLPLMDADILARDAMAAETPLFGELLERYGAAILHPNGTLNRARLGELVFASKAELLWLEQRIHPYVCDRLQTWLEARAIAQTPTVAIVVPLLFEARMTDLVTEIWTVCCTPEQQVQRIQQRNRTGISLEQIHARIARQSPIEAKIRLADCVIDNSSTPEALFQQVDAALCGTHIRRP